MGRSGLSCSVAFNGAACFANVLIAQPQKHSVLSHLALEPPTTSLSGIHKLIVENDYSLLYLYFRPFFYARKTK